MSLVGKSSCIAVDAISEMGDNLKINFWRSYKQQQKKYFILVSKRLYICMSNWTSRFSRCFTGIWKRNTIVIGAFAIQTKYILLG
jgi:peroxiredoxin (alkyl hydroperoxide reductase subunit C)